MGYSPSVSFSPGGCLCLRAWLHKPKERETFPQDHTASTIDITLRWTFFPRTLPSQNSSYCSMALLMNKRGRQQPSPLVYSLERAQSQERPGILSEFTTAGHNDPLLE